MRACNNLPQAPKTKDVVRGLRKIVACSQSSSQCLLVNPRRAHAPEGYSTWSVCVSVCLSVCLSVRHHESCHYAQLSVQPKVPTASAQSGKHFKYGVFSKNALVKSYGVKKPTSLVCAYRDILWRRWSDISPEISKTGPSLVLSKSNGRFQAT